MPYHILSNMETYLGGCLISQGVSIPFRLGLTNFWSSCLIFLLASPSYPFNCRWYSVDTVVFNFTVKFKTFIADLEPPPLMRVLGTTDLDSICIVKKLSQFIGHYYNRRRPLPFWHIVNCNKNIKVATWRWEDPWIQCPNNGKNRCQKHIIP